MVPQGGPALTVQVAIWGPRFLPSATGARTSESAVRFFATLVLRNVLVLALSIEKACFSETDALFAAERGSLRGMG